MKKLIILIAVFFAAFSVSAQQKQIYDGEYYYQGEVVVTLQDSTKAVIVFNKSGSGYIVKEPRLEQGKEYTVLMRKVQLKGTVETGKIMFFHFSDRQNFRDIEAAKNSISMVLKIKWI